MWEMDFLGIPFFDIFYNFFIYCFLGWIYESTYVSIKEKHWVNRGFLNGPIIPIYGCVATLLFVSFFNEKTIATTLSKTIQSYLFIFITGMLLASLFEFVTSWLMEKLFHARWWDYSDIPLNIQGRICLPVSIFWGMLSVIMAELIQPRMDILVAMIPPFWGKIVGYLIFFVFVVDVVTTVIATLELDKKLSDMQKIREEFVASLDTLKLYETVEELRAILAETPMYEHFGNKRSEFEIGIEKWMDKVFGENYEAEFRLKRAELKAQAEDFYLKFRAQKNTFVHRYIYKRIFKAFPHVTFHRGKEVLGAFRERIRNDWKYREEKK